MTRRGRTGGTTADGGIGREGITNSLEGQSGKPDQQFRSDQQASAGAAVRASSRPGRAAVSSRRASLVAGGVKGCSNASCHAKATQAWLLAPGRNRPGRGTTDGGGIWFPPASGGGWRRIGSPRRGRRRARGPCPPYRRFGPPIETSRSGGGTGCAAGQTARGSSVQRGGGRPAGPQATAHSQRAGSARKLQLPQALGEGLDDQAGCEFPLGSGPAAAHHRGREIARLIIPCHGGRRRQLGRSHNKLIGRKQRALNRQAGRLLAGDGGISWRTAIEPGLAEVGRALAEG